MGYRPCASPASDRVVCSAVRSGSRKEPRWSPIRLVAYALILLPVVLGFVLVRLFGVDVPFGDVWTMVPRFNKLSVGALGFQDLWALHWEHRVFFPRILLLLVGIFADFNQVVVMYLIQVLLLITLAVTPAGLQGRRRLEAAPLRAHTFFVVQPGTVLQPV